MKNNNDINGLLHIPSVYAFINLIKMLIKSKYIDTVYFILKNVYY